MSTSPRDSGIPMLTEVIEEDDMNGVAPLPADETQAVADETPVAPVAQRPAQATAPPPAGGAYAQQGARLQYGPPAQFAASYPLPLKPAAQATLADAPAASLSDRAGGPIAEGAPLAAPMGEDDWQRMERRVRERILGQLLSRTDAMLEERIRGSIAGVLEQAVDGLAATLRASLHKTLEDVVSRAVAQEISRLQLTKK